jgi:hypothetical protein
MWGEREADPPDCAGAGAEADPAPTLDDGFPHGRALCSVCGRFVRPRQDGTIPRHRSWRGDRTLAEAARRREWFNTFGW